MTVKVSVTLPPPAVVPTKVTVGAGSNAKFLARSIDRSENGWPLSCVSVILVVESAGGAKAANAWEPAKKIELGPWAWNPEENPVAVSVAVSVNPELL